MEGAIVYGLSATLLFAQYDKILDFVFSDYEKTPLILKKSKDKHIFNTKDKIKVVMKSGMLFEGRYVSISNIDKTIHLFGITHGQGQRDYYSKIYQFNIEEISSIQKGFGNKSIKYGLGYGAFIGIPSLIWLKTMQVNMRGSGDKGWGALAPLSLLILGTPIFSLLGLSEGLNLPYQFEKTMSIGESEWMITDIIPAH